ncbi:hypothetical protein PNEG_00429 [Pneumocystis murina B123]|uniref:Tr-type G domain-containing protein n=1 Tax=Pneumocystis murina (strain B123) TaxID=1069680 RepID=M7NW93_PNEMU|nr:hypothetical protein PNEG_00429 [Pneumocystis murina B123]EMR11406.1 hypothetical protein PNEG_00429 [Pneumocystis murina B123]
MDETLYDEFGNYIGKAESEEEEQETVENANGAYLNDEEIGLVEAYLSDDELEEIPQAKQAIVLHEDKQYYPSASEVYGPDVEILVHEEDTQPLSEAIIQPIKVKKFSLEEMDFPATHYSKEFMINLMSFPEFVRNIALVGNLHHGKTSFLDMLIHETHDIKTESKKMLKYSDVHILERDRGLSIKATPMSLVLQNTKGKSFLFNIIDTPGHVNFVDEVASSIRLVDGAILIVDAIEGVLVNTDKIVRYSVLENIPFVLVINKVDRLILELKLPPADAYFKLRHTIEEINSIIKSCSTNDYRLSPEKGNVCFASTDMNWCFSLFSFAKMYADTYDGVNIDDFSQRLWGDIYYNPQSRNFTRKSVEQDAKRTFVHFILEPLYKLYGQTLGEPPEVLDKTLKSLGIFLKPAQFKLDSKALLKLICGEFFGTATGFVDMVIKHIPSPIDGSVAKIHHTYTGPLDSEIAQNMLKCDPNGHLVIHTTKLLNTIDATEFFSLGRVMSGTIHSGDQVKVLGENYSIDDEEDMVYATVSGVWVGGARYRIPVNSAVAGSIVLLAGVDNSILKTATIVSRDIQDDIYIFRPVKHFTESVFKVAVEPVNPSELPKMLSGLRMINKSYPLSVIKVEESGEHIIFGTGELYMDCILHDLRKLYSEIEIKVSDPIVKFCETVVETSAVKCYASTPNKKNKITMIAEPLDDGIAEDIETGKVNIKWPIRKVGEFFQKYQWDILASRSIWAFGPNEQGPNVLLDDTLPSEVDKKLLNTVRDSIRQGFQWGTREGPLCEEPIRNVKFKILDVTLATEPIYRGGGQIIPTVRRTCYSSFLMATPRLMEPIYYVEIQAPADCISAVYTVLGRRRGHVTQDIPKAGSPLYTIKALIPIIDASGFETDLRTHTQGQAFCQQIFDHWQVVPGDPLDKTCVLQLFEPASGQSLARDFMLKTRRRKGLVEDVVISKYLDEEMMMILAQTDILKDNFLI